ncbi:MAG: hypothetical protein GF398_18220 [Chitinivibrionales bacterium]|nr:hypothetical protein [Chitinivibrionales bacterium]
MRDCLIEVLLLLLPCCGCPPEDTPQNIRIHYREKLLDIFWDAAPGACGYNLYAKPNPDSSFRQINPNLITTKPHFSYIWDIVDGQRVRAVKGRRHYIAVTSVCSTQTGKALSESRFSEVVDNCYFEGFRRICSYAEMQPVLQQSQSREFLPVDQRPAAAGRVGAFLQGPGAAVMQLIRDSIDPLELGACAPITTVLVKLLNAYGITAYRVDGTFIKEFHAFCIINIDMVEYVLDFTADQFVPDAAPVLAPRDLCYLDTKGKLSREGTPVYMIGKVFAADKIYLSGDEDSRLYRVMLKTGSDAMPR